MVLFSAASTNARWKRIASSPDRRPAHRQHRRQLVLAEHAARPELAVHDRVADPGVGALRGADPVLADGFLRAAVVTNPLRTGPAGAYRDRHPTGIQVEYES